MTNSRIKKTWKSVQLHINKTVGNVSKENNKLDWDKEEELINRLQIKLGKSREEIKNIISKDLLSTLILVPFNINETK
jgi:hypothetical protein